MHSSKSKFSLLEKLNYRKSLKLTYPRNVYDLNMLFPIQNTHLSQIFCFTKTIFSLKLFFSKGHIEKTNFWELVKLLIAKTLISARFRPRNTKYAKNDLKLEYYFDISFVSRGSTTNKLNGIHSSFLFKKRATQKIAYFLILGEYFFSPIFSQHFARDLCNDTIFYSCFQNYTNNSTSVFNFFKVSTPFRIKKKIIFLFFKKKIIISSYFFTIFYNFSNQLK